jgi:hypothetical protein
MTNPQDIQLLKRTTCPHCWHGFPPEDVLWVSSHTDLLGDPRLGPEKQQCFLPTRFGLDGNARDSHGVTCTNLACPNCHLSIPRGLLEMEPFFVSILGAPGCGKSYLLSALTWGLRQVLPRDFALNFQDADLVANAPLNEYEQSLFLNPQQDEQVPLADLIRKTELQGQLYDTVTFGNQSVSFPRPFLFSLTPADRHPNAATGEKLSRMLCVYDNAGEHFQPGMDTTHSQATRHLTQSRVLMFLFDPTQDQRFRERLQGKDTSLPAGTFTSRQELVLLEVASRVRRLTNLPQSVRHPHPLFVLVTKYDVWSGLLGGKVITDDPWKTTRQQIAGLDTERIGETSVQVRRLLMETCPELISAAEGFCDPVVYLPVSALGRKPMLDPATRRWTIRPRALRPIWAAVPMLYGLHRSLQGMISSLKPPAPGPRGPQAGGAKKPSGVSRAVDRGR